MKSFLIYLSITWMGLLSAFAQNRLEPGDIVVIGYTARDPDQFTLLALKDIDPGNIIYISDAGYDSTLRQFRPGEGYLSYTVPATGWNKGQTITYPSDPGFVRTGVQGFWGLSMVGDQLSIFQGSYASPEFLFLLHTGETDWQTRVLDNQTTSLPQGLIPNRTALHWRFTNGYFQCRPEWTSKEMFLEALSDSTRWVFSSQRLSTLHPSCQNTVLQLTLSPHNHFNSLENDSIERIQVVDEVGNVLCSASSIEEVWRYSYLFHKKYCIFIVYYRWGIQRFKIYTDS